MPKKSYKELKMELNALKAKNLKKDTLKMKVQRFFTPRGNEDKLLKMLKGY